MLGGSALSAPAGLWLLFSGSSALAVCAPPAGAGTPAPGSAVICSGATTDQNATAGYGNGSQNGLSIEVQSGATVTGTDNGFNLGNANTITNRGSILGQNLVGVLGNGTLTITNFGNIAGDTGVASDVVSLTNHGGITGVSSGLAAVAGAATASIVNLGTISGGDRGIEGGTLNLVNSGSILATNAGTGAAVSFVDATIINNSSGVIAGTIRGIASTGTVDIVNHGTIQATAFGGLGINATNGTITNHGSITASGGSGRGIGADGTLAINNAGTIAANGNNGAGILANNGSIVTINNTGTISATATSGNAILGNSGTVNLNNSGTITGGVGLTAAAAGPAPWVVNNAGTIAGTAVLAGTTFAIDFRGSGGDTINLLPGSRILGRVLLGAGSNISFAAGNIASLTTFGFPLVGGGLVATGSTVTFANGLPYAVNGDQVATLEPTAIALADKTLATFTDGVSSLVRDRMSESEAGSGDSAAFASAQGISATYDATSAFAHAGRRALNDGSATVWMKAFGGAHRRSAEGAMLEANTTNYGAALGIDRRATDRLLLGAFFGAGEGRLRVAGGSQSVDTEYAFGGAYARYDLDAQFLDAAFTGGVSRNASTRAVTNNLVPNGMESATASYHGWFVSPEIAYGVRIPVHDFVAIPRARLRYVAGAFEGYSEAGSAQNLSVGHRAVQNLEERLELALTRLDAVGSLGWLRTTITGGAVATQRIGGTSVDAVLIGQNISFATPGDNTAVGFYAGAGLDYRMTRNVSLFAGADGTLMSDKNAAITARGGVSVSF